jgi:hypothetical protein
MHLDSHCVCTINEALYNILLLATMCAYTVYTSTTTRAHFNQFELIRGSLRYPQHLQLLLLFHVLQINHCYSCKHFYKSATVKLLL